MNSNSPTGTLTVLEAYIKAMKTVFGHEPWEAIEASAELAWAQCRMEGDPHWPEVRERLMAEWR